MKTEKVLKKAFGTDEFGFANVTGKIGDKLSLSVKTISTYRLRLMSKLKLQSNADIVKYSIRNGILAID